MFNALQELSRAPGGKSLNDMSSSICGFLLSCYKDDGNEYYINYFHIDIIACWHMYHICFSEVGLVATCG